METGDRSASAGNVCYTDISACDLDARLFGGRYLVLASTASRAIEVYDLKTHKNIFKKYNLPRGDLLRQALISLDGKLVLQINSDGSFAGFRVSDAAQLFEGRYVDDEVVLWAPDGRFDATSEGAHYVSLRLPGRVGTYTFAQFSAQLETHGLAGKLLDGSAPAPVTLVSPPSLSGQIEAAGGHLTGTAEASGDTPLSALLVFQDGLLTNRLDPPQAGTHASWNINVDLLPGTRWASLVAVDEKGLASLPMGRDLPAAAPRRVHVLAVGLDHYQDPDIPTLEFGQSDARRFAGALDRIGKNVEIASSRILDEKDATKGGVLKALHETLAAAKPGETVVLFFAGHGVRDTDGTYYLATADTKIADIAGSALPWSDVAAELANQKSRIAVFLDTCHSGAAETDTFSTNDSVAASLLEKVPSGIVVFSAAKGRELSEEAPSAGGGIFTTALVNVIGADRKRFDTNGDGAIEISELYRGVKSAVVADTDGRQTPWIARNQMVGDFALF